MPRLEFKQSVDKYNRAIETMTVLDDDGKESREHYLSQDRAKELLENEFTFNEGKDYIIKVKTSVDWKSMRPFEYHQGIDLMRHFYNESSEQELYGRQATERKDIHIFTIRVEEMS